MNASISTENAETSTRGTEAHEKPRLKPLTRH
jgi:hypothetical protein